MSEHRLVSWPWSKASGTPKTAARPLVELQDHMNHLFDELWAGFDASGFPGRVFAEKGEDGGYLNPSTDLKETDDGVSMEMELPGLEEKDISVELKGDRIVVTGEKKEAKEEEDKEKGYRHIERSYGSFQRSFGLPPSADTSKASAVFRNGVLTVSIPKNPKEVEAAKKIEIASG